MAHSWIKVRKTFVDDPNLNVLAKGLGVTKDHALGLLVRFWVWKNKQRADGEVLTAASIDNAMKTPGFAEQLKLMRFDPFNTPK